MRSARARRGPLDRSVFALLAVAALALPAACGMADDDPGETDDVPLGSYDDLFNGAPANSTLPDDNKADAVYPAKHAELVGQQSPVKSQGRRGVCSIFARARI